jgi:menaquinone-dependent protoporphyrinogen oxidase
MAHYCVLYATREGQTRRIADHVRGVLEARGQIAEAFDVAALPPSFTLASFDVCVLAASVHVGQHEPEMIAFVRREREVLARMPTALLSVSMTESVVERAGVNPSQREAARADVERQLRAFHDATGFEPSYVQPVAGALRYSQYGFLKRMLVKQIAKRSGGPTDTRQDYEFTDWLSLDRFVERVVTESEASLAARVPA